MSETTKASEPPIEEGCCFKWDQHQTHLSNVVRQLLDEECMVDVTLVADGERIQAHRIVLSSCSSFFQEILSQSNEPHTTIILSDISAKDVRSIIEFSYHGEVRIPVENISNLLEAAHELKICGLMEIDGLDENDAIISAKDIGEDNVNEFEDFDESSDNTSDHPEVPLSRKNVRNSSEESENESSKRKKRRGHSSKRNYSEEMLSSAINDLKAGRTLMDASSNHKIPRSTLYMRAKALGIQLNGSRNEYPTECMKAAINAVIEGSSLQYAANKFFIPKTVLWRRMQKESYQILRSEDRRSYGADKREAAVKALEQGENLTKVAQKYKIPKTTLFRDKVKLVDEGKLPGSYWKKRKASNEDANRSRLEEAVAACKDGRMSQAAASTAYRIPKTTIWRRLQRVTKPGNGAKRTLKNKNEREDAKNEQENSGFGLCEVSSEIPITYIDQNLPTDSVIILTTADVDELNLDESKQIIVNDSGQNYVPCTLNIENTGNVEYQQAES